MIVVIEKAIGCTSRGGCDSKLKERYKKNGTQCFLSHATAFAKWLKIIEFHL